MIKKINSLLVSMLLLMSFVTAITMPHPVYGEVNYNGQPLSSVEIKYENFNTGVTTTTETNENGVYLLELANIDMNYRNGDDIRVTVLFCSSNSECVKTDTLDGGGNLIDFDVSSTYIPPDQVTPNTKLTSDDSVVSIEAFYRQDIDVVIGNNKLPSLLDEEIEFNDEDYDINEEIHFKGIVQTSIDDVDFGLTPYLVVLKGDMKYRYNFEDAIDLTEITEDESLEITLAGKEIEITSASADEITLFSGTEFDNLKEGDSVTYEGKEIEIQMIGEDFVKVSYDGVSETISEEDYMAFGDIEIYVEEANEDDDQPDICDIIVGEDIKETIQDGDDYYGEIFEWEINLPNYIGITNQEDYEELDEDYVPFAEGEGIVLPNGMEIVFSEVTTSDMTELTIEVDDGYLRVYGADKSFSFGTEDYSEVLVNALGIYDEDEVLITNDKIQIGDSDTYLELGSIEIGKLKVFLDMSDILYDGVSFVTKDSDYLDEYGLIFIDPQDAEEERKGFSIVVPEERPEVKISIGIIEEDEEEIPEDCPVCEEKICTETECQDTICTSCPITECPTCECDECPEPEGDNIGAMIISLLSVFLVGGVGGIYFTKNKTLGLRSGTKIYKNNKGVEVLLHKHPGITGYHDPKVSHKDIKEKHPRGQILPHYEKVDEVWTYKK